MRELNLRHLAGLAAAVRQKSLSAAARHVNITQPALTQGIARLEAQLGVMLLDRHPAGATPTAAALSIASRIERALAHIGSRRATMAQLRALVALARAGSYRGAAQATGLAEPTLHRSVADLGIALRRTLVERRGKGVALTPQGQRIARGFALAIAEIAAAQDELAAFRGVETGRIAIGAMPLSRARLLPAAVAAFVKRYPDFGIRIVEGAYTELIEPLRCGEIDIAIGALRAAEAAPDLVERPLFADRPAIVARAGHPLAGTTPNVVALRGYPWAMSGPGTPLRAIWEQLFNGDPPPVPVECGSVITIREILRGSDFLTLLSPDQVAAERAAGWLALIEPPPPCPVRTIGLITRVGWQPTAMQAAFLREIEAIALQQT